MTINNRSFRFIQSSGLLFIFITLIFSCAEKKAAVKRESFTIESDGVKLKVEVVTDSIVVPFGMDFLPDGSLLVTDRVVGNIVVVNTENGQKALVQDVPAVLGQGDCGMLDILVHPDYEKNGWIYFSYTTGDTSSNTMVVDRAKLDGLKLVQRERLFTALPFYNRPLHHGSRLVLKDGYLFIGMGEKTDLKDSAQTLSNHLGKILRILEDGKIPTDNPYVNTPNAKPEVWSYGHRNPNGLTLNPFTGELWEHEHGPKGGDEINIIKPTLNYGWPVISYGVNYDDTPVNEGLSEKEGMEQPVYYYKPSIAPSGMQFYTSDVIPSWKGNLFIGAMVLKHLNRLVIEGNKVVREERLLTDKNWRVRSVKQGPDGYLYLGVDGGKILRIMPE
ncbi:PQQ-dependent sugar dehydrogenase [Chryseolinea sp. H1M3-3]|uniref:PQQ-dependent sugar dehydrogenase n=1 Tax=Chryseolinea sp. H1M3-3 TaxID=3034144 RepID=UPI0023ED830A|nr:PQQ-dependent sugar dehydrogenase [Chryseolinea sp. H1M3-3]